MNGIGRMDFHTGMRLGTMQLNTAVNTFKRMCLTLSVNGHSLCQNLRPWVLYILTGWLGGLLSKDYLLSSLPILFRM